MLLYLDSKINTILILLSATVSFHFFCFGAVCVSTSSTSSSQPLHASCSCLVVTMDGVRDNALHCVDCSQSIFKSRRPQKQKHEPFGSCFLFWCGHRDLNSDGFTIRPSNVRVCLFRHDRSQPTYYMIYYLSCQEIFKSKLTKFICFRHTGLQAQE